MARQALEFTVILPAGLGITNARDLSRIVSSRDLDGGKREVVIKVDAVTNVQLLEIVRVD